MNNRDQRKEYCLQNRDRIKEYQLKNHDKIKAPKKIYSSFKEKSDKNFRLFRKPRIRIRQALIRKTKTISTKEFSSIDIDLYRKWIEYQFTPEMN